MDTNQGFQTIIERYITWAQNREDVRAAVMIGSRARSDHPADEWSDLDIIFATTDPGRYRSNTHWYESLGKSYLSFMENTPGGGFERRVLFDGGLDVDFVPMPIDSMQWMLEHEPDPFFISIVKRGIRILVDKDGMAAKLVDLASKAPLAPETGNRPAQEEFSNNTGNFWYHTVWSAKHLKRGELWWGKSCVDDHLKGLLRQMLEWHARATGSVHDTWMRGRFLEEWIDRRALAALPQIYAHYDPDDIWCALHATMDLFAWVGRETADKWQLEYPFEGEKYAVELVNEIEK